MNVQVVSDQKLLNCYLSGDRNAISQLIERHSRRVRDYIQMMVKDGDVADDIFQETFIKAVRVIDEGRYTDNGRFLSWILRIAHNQVIDHFRAQKQNRQLNEAKDLRTVQLHDEFLLFPFPISTLHTFFPTRSEAVSVSRVRRTTSCGAKAACSAAWWSCCPTSSARW